MELRYPCQRRVTDCSRSSAHRCQTVRSREENYRYGLRLALTYLIRRVRGGTREEGRT